MNTASKNHEKTTDSSSHPTEHTAEPEDAMQIDLVPAQPPSLDYQNINTAMDLFSRHLFAYPTSNQDVKQLPGSF